MAQPRPQLSAKQIAYYTAQMTSVMDLRVRVFRLTETPNRGGISQSWEEIAADVWAALIPSFRRVDEVTRGEKPTAVANVTFKVPAQTDIREKDRIHIKNDEGVDEIYEVLGLLEPKSYRFVDMFIAVKLD